MSNSWNVNNVIVLISLVTFFTVFLLVLLNCFVWMRRGTQSLTELLLIILI